MHHRRRANLHSCVKLRDRPHLRASDAGGLLRHVRVSLAIKAHSIVNIALAGVTSSQNGAKAESDGATEKQTGSYGRGNQRRKRLSCQTKIFH